MQRQNSKSRRGIVGTIVAISLVLVLALAMVSTASKLVARVDANTMYTQYNSSSITMRADDVDGNADIDDVVVPDDNGNIGDIYNPGDLLTIISHPKSQDYTLGSDDLRLSVVYNWANGQSNRMSFLWYVSTNGSTDFRAINPSVVPSATAQTLVFPSNYLNGDNAVVAFVVRIQGQGVQGASVNVLSNTAVINIIEGVASRPVFETQPSSALVAINSSHTLTAIASANGQIAYQWYFNTQDTTYGAVEIEDKNTSSLVVDTSMSGVTYYFVKAINTVVDNGEAFVATTNSDIAKIDVQVQPKAPVIIDQSIDATVQLGTEKELFVTVAEVGDTNSLSYQWYENTQNVNHSGTAMEGFVDSTIMLVPQQAGVKHYYVVVTNTVEGEKYATASSVITITVVEQSYNPIIVDLTSTPLEVLPNEEVVLEVKATVVDGVESLLTYQWYFSGEDNFVGSYKLENETEFNLTVTRSEPGTNYYFVVVTNTVNDIPYDTISRSVQVTVIEDELLVGRGNADGKSNLSGGGLIDGSTTSVVLAVVLSSGVLLVVFVFATILLTKKKSKAKTCYNYNDYRY